MCREVIDQSRATARSIRRYVFPVKAVISSDSEVWLHKSHVCVQQKFPSAHCCPKGTKALHCCSDTSIKTVQNNSDTARWRHVWEIHTSCSLLSLSPALVSPLALNLICVYLTCLIPECLKVTQTMNQPLTYGNTLLMYRQLTLKRQNWVH